MNILIFFSQPWRVGGAETHVESMISGLYENNKIFLVVNEGSDIISLNRLKNCYPNLEILSIQARGYSIIKWHESYKNIEKLIIANKFDIISAHQRTAGIWSYFLSKRTGTPYVVT